MEVSLTFFPELTPLQSTVRAGLQQLQILNGSILMSALCWFVWLPLAMLRQLPRLLSSPAKEQRENQAGWDQVTKVGLGAECVV